MEKKKPLYTLQNSFGNTSYNKIVKQIRCKNKNSKLGILCIYI